MRERLAGATSTGSSSPCFTEPHSTKPFEDGVRYGWATTRRRSWTGPRRLARQRRARARAPRALPDAGDPRRRRPARAVRQAARRSTTLVPGARLLTIGGGGHLTRGARPGGLQPRGARLRRPARRARSTWVRAHEPQAQALFISSPIGLGHVQRDLAIARELRKLQPDLDDRLVHRRPGGALPRAEGERAAPDHAAAGQREPRTSSTWPASTTCTAFFALRTMDEIMINNFMTFTDLMEAGALRPRDRRRGLGRRLLLPREPGAQAPAVRVPDRLRRLPADGATTSARRSCAPTATPTTSSTSRASRTCATPRSSSATRRT